MISQIRNFLDLGGPVLWVIAILSIVTLTVILWKIWHLVRMRAWAYRASARAVAFWIDGDRRNSLSAIAAQKSLRARTVTAAMRALSDPNVSFDQAREETTRTAKTLLSDARTGFRLLELVVVIAPLLGLLGTVIGMIEAFQTLQASSNGADAAELAGGIWAALLTTAAGMSVAIPAQIALTWFEGVVERAQSDMEDLATRLFTRGRAA